MVMKVNLGAAKRLRDNAMGAETQFVGRIYGHPFNSRAAALHHVRKLRRKEPDSLVLTVAADRAADLKGFEQGMEGDIVFAKRKTEAARLYSSGMSLRQVAEMVPQSYETIRAWLVEQGIPIRGRGAQRSELSGGED